MIDIEQFISGFYDVFSNEKNLYPWQLTQSLQAIVEGYVSKVDDQFEVANGIAVHTSATIESGAVVKPPAIISANCFVAANSYVRGGVYLGKFCIIGPGCEVKSSIIFHHSVVAHMNFIADSIIGGDVNFEAGSLTANHYNERVWKEISVVHESKIISTNTTRFGSLIGDHCRIGANAVLSPGTLLNPETIVARLDLIDQFAKENK